MSERCRERVHDGGRSVRLHQCRRYAIADGFCKQHHPDTVKAREAKTEEAWQAKREREPLQIALRRIAELEAAQRWIKPSEQQPPLDAPVWLYDGYVIWPDMWSLAWGAHPEIKAWMLRQEKPAPPQEAE